MPHTHTHGVCEWPCHETTDTSNTTTSNLDRLFGLLSDEARQIIFQALCTERDRLTALGAEAVQVSALAEVYASNLVADQCCGKLLATHAYCPAVSA